MKRIVSIGIVLMMLFTACMPVMAESSGEIELKLNQSVFKAGQEVVVSTVLKKEAQAFANGEVLLTVKHEASQNVIFLRQLLTNENGEANARFIIGSSKETGNYVVTASGLGTLKTASFQVGGGQENNALISTDKASYQLGETVKIGGKLIIAGEVMSNRSAIIKAYCKDQLVFANEVLTGEDGAFSTNFTVSRMAGTYTILLTAQGSEFNTKFEVSQDNEGSSKYHIEGSTDRQNYAGGEIVKITGKATTLKSGAKKVQGPITVMLVSNGKEVVKKTVFVAQNGQFSTTILLPNKTSVYDVVLKNQTAEKVMEIKVTKQKWY